MGVDRLARLRDKPKIAITTSTDAIHAPREFHNPFLTLTLICIYIYILQPVSYYKCKLLKRVWRAAPLVFEALFVFRFVAFRLRWAPPTQAYRNCGVDCGYGLWLLLALDMYKVYVNTDMRNMHIALTAQLWMR